MDQSHLCGLWKRRRPPSKKTLPPARNLLPVREEERQPRERYPPIHDRLHNRPVNIPVAARDLVVLDEKCLTTLNGCSAGPSHSSLNTKTCRLIVEDGFDDFIPRSYGSKGDKNFEPAIGSFHMKDGQAFHLKRQQLHQHLGPSRAPKIDDMSSNESTLARWLRHCVTPTVRRQRQSPVIPTSHDDAIFHIDPLSSPIPGIGIEPPIIPDDLTSGAAARAAAATQNEILEFVRNLKLAGTNIARDTESGIGIELRDRVLDGIDVPIPRKDPVTLLPEELVVQILSYLDAGSLIEAELVSRRWQQSASSHVVWKHIFHEEFGYPLQRVNTQSAQFQNCSPGLGKLLPDQDWKTMWRARKALSQRWQDGHAAAIYLEGHTDSIYCVQFDEHKIVTGSRDRTIRVWDAHTYECIAVLGVPSRNTAVAVPPLPNNLLTGRGLRPFTKIISSSASPEPTYDSSGLYHNGSILCLQYNDSIMITGSSDCTCIVWDLTTGYRPIRRLRHHTAGVLDVCLDSKYIVTCSKDTTVCLWNQATGELLRKLSGHRGPVNAVQMRGDLLVSASGDGIAKLWNLTSGLCIKEFPSKDRGMACVEFSPDARTILAGGNDQVIYQFDTTSGELVRELDGHHGLVRSLHLDNANGRVVSGSYDYSVKVWDIATGKNIVDFMGWTTSWILSAKADYRRIVATSQDSRAVVMDFGYNLKGVELLEGG